MNKVRTERIKKMDRVKRIMLPVCIAIFMIGLIGSCATGTGLIGSCATGRFTLADVGEVEVTELRTETSRTYYLGDDQYRLISTGYLHYKDAYGVWQQIDNAIIGDQMIKDAYNIRLLQDTFNAGQILEWSVDSEYVRFQPQPLGWTNDLSQIEQIAIPQAVTGEVTNTPMPLLEEGDGYIQGRIDWPAAYGSGIDFSWTCNPAALNKLLTITNPLSSPAQYIIDGGNAALRLSFIFAPSASMEIYTDGVVWDKSTTVTTHNAIEFRKDGAMLWVFRPVAYWDSSGDRVAGDMTLRRAGNKLYVDILVPYSWLEAAQYPISIDPSLTVQPSSKDTYISEANSTTNYGTADYMYVGVFYSGGNDYARRALVEFAIDWGTDIPAGAGIISADMSLYKYGDFLPTDGRTYNCYRLVRLDWEETEACWIWYRLDPTPKSWAIVGASHDGNDYTTTDGAQQTVPADYNWQTWDITNQVDWAQTNDKDVACRVSDNDESEAASYQSYFRSKEYGTPALRPKLVIEYTAVDPPTVITSAATNVEDTTATLNGEVTDTGGADPTVTVYWGDEDGETTPEAWDNSSAPTSPAQPQGAETFYKDATSLATGTTIFFTARAVNDGGTDWASTESFLTKPAAPTNVDATDGDHTDKVVITWTKSTGATGYKVYRDDELIDTIGDVATYDDTGADAPTITAGSAVASDGSSTAHVALSLSGTSTSVGTTHTYKLKAVNGSGDSDDSDTDTGHRGVGSLTYQWQRSAADSDADYGNIDGATSATHDDTAAPAGNITAGSTVASDGSSTAHVSLSLSGTSTSVGDGRYYQCVLDADGAAQQISDDDRGHRDVGALTYQWQRSAADSDADYGNIDGATSATHDDTGAPAPTITAGNTTASDGIDCAYVALNLTGSASNNGDGRYYRCALNATGAASETSAVDRGYRGTSALSYQWHRSSNDADADYSTISGGTVSYNDTGGAYTPDGRYYLCRLDMSDAVSQNSSVDRGYMALPDLPVVTAHNATGIGNDSARLRGEILNTGCDGGYITTVGFEWGISTGNYSYSWNATGQYGLGIFTRTITDLQAITRYYWRAFIINAGGTNYSAELDFLTGSLPLAPEDLTITQVGVSSISLNWTKGIGADTTIIIVNESGYPESRADGYIAYSGNGTGIILNGLSLAMTGYYYRAWSLNEEGYSVGYAQASIGDPISIASILFVIALCGFALWKKSWIRILLAICILIWAVWVVPYDIKVAAPLVCLGTILFVSSIFVVYRSREKETAPEVLAKEELLY